MGFSPGIDSALRRTILPLALIGAVTLAETVGSDLRVGRTEGSTAIVIGHRLASGDRPEHTLEAYWLAIQEGADYVEPATSGFLFGGGIGLNRKSDRKRNPRSLFPLGHERDSGGVARERCHPSRLLLQDLLHAER